MRGKGKLSSILQSMSDDKSRNKKIINKNIDFLLNYAQEKNLVDDLISLKYEDYKTRILLIRFLRMISIEDRNIIMQKRDKDNNTILHIVAQNSNDIKLVTEMIKSNLTGDVFSYAFLKKKNNQGKSFFDIVLNKNLIDNEQSSDFINMLSLIAPLDISLIINNYDLIIKRLKDFNISNGHPVFDVENTLRSICKPQIVKIVKNFFNDDKEENIKLIKDIFGDINYTDDAGSSLLWDCVDEGVIFKDTISKLLEIGVNPNIQNRFDDTFIHYAIEHNDSSDEIISVLMTSVDYGYDINQRPTIMKQLFDCWGLTYETVKVYKFLCQNNFNSSNVHIVESHFTNLGSCKLEFIKIYRINVVSDLVVDKLTSLGFNFETDFKKKIINILLDFYKEMQQLGITLEGSDNLNLINLLTEGIIDAFNSNKNCIYKEIRVVDFLDGLKYVVSKQQQIVVDKINQYKVKELYN